MAGQVVRLTIHNIPKLTPLPLSAQQCIFASCTPLIAACLFTHSTSRVGFLQHNSIRATTFHAAGVKVGVVCIRGENKKKERKKKKKDPTRTTCLTYVPLCMYSTIHARF